VQAGVLAGRADARELRSAAEQERTAVDALVQIARGLLSSGGHELSATTIERVAETLHAAALDDEARGEVSEGRLVRELRHVGLGVGLGGAVAEPAPRPTSDRPAKPPRGGREGRARQAQKRDESAEAERQTAKQRKAAEAAELREREQARKQARAVERDASREVDRAERALRTAQERQTRAVEALRQAEAAVQDAEAGVDAAVAAHRQAKQRLDDV
jgi:flagellar biosynthesis GTPase FlhF